MNSKLIDRQSCSKDGILIIKKLSRESPQLFHDFVFNTIKSFVILIIILDPFLGMMVFVSLTREMKKKERASQAFVAVVVAFALLLIFLFAGQLLFGLLSLTISSFIVAGGVILLILGINQVLGMEFHKSNDNAKVAAVVIGTPLLCGPGAISTIIILSQQHGFAVPLVALLMCISITWLMLYFSGKISAIFGERIIEIISRILGLILAAMAVEFIKDGVVEMVREIIRKGS